MELHKKYRPSLFKHVVGQPGVCSAIRAYLHNKTLPHALLFSGASGCGKTTLARIVARNLGCVSPYDLTELNAADARGIDTIREIAERCTTLPLSSPCRVWILDEAHKLTNEAQNSLLKLLEEPPAHVYFQLCTTDPGKLLKTVVNRCTQFKLSPVSVEDMEALLKRVAEKEGISLPESVLDRIVKVADGCPRQALVLLDKVSVLSTEEECLDAIEKSTADQEGIDLARALLKPKPSWPDIATVLKNLDEDPETVRRILLAYMTSVVLGGGKLASHAREVMARFEGHFYDSGKAGLVGACWDAVHGG